MAPPLLPARLYGPSRPVTIDTPPDLLEGSMDLHVTLPSEKTILMSVHRSTPMMDLLVQITTAHRIAPGGHFIQVISDNIFLSYKPSTPIGTLDTTAIKIVPKSKLNDATKMRRKSILQPTSERNIRLKVNLPRNQLAVYRVPPKTLISDVLAMVCKDKSLDESVHEIRHPVNIDERLRGSCSLNDYQLQEICLVPKDFRPPPLSVTDLISMASLAHPEDKKRRGFLNFFSRKSKSSTGDSSVSSGSAGERSVSPARSDESADGRPAPRALSPAASTDTLTHTLNGSHLLPSSVASTSSHNQSTNSLRSSASNTTSGQSPSRPTSLLNLSKGRKRPAPVPPSVKNNKGPTSKETRENLLVSRTNLESSDDHENKSSPSSPVNFEANSMEMIKSNQSPSSNLNFINTTSMSSIASKNKRRAPPPPKLTSKKEPSAIIEEVTDRNLINDSASEAAVSPVHSLESSVVNQSITEESVNDIVEPTPSLGPPSITSIVRTSDSTDISTSRLVESDEKSVDISTSGLAKNSDNSPDSFMEDNSERMTSGIVIISDESKRDIIEDSIRTTNELPAAASGATEKTSFRIEQSIDEPFTTKDVPSVDSAFETQLEEQPLVVTPKKSIVSSSLVPSLTSSTSKPALHRSDDYKNPAPSATVKHPGTTNSNHPNLNKSTEKTKLSNDISSNRLNSSKDDQSSPQSPSTPVTYFGSNPNNTNKNDPSVAKVVDFPAFHNVFKRNKSANRKPFVSDGTSHSVSDDSGFESASRSRGKEMIETSHRTFFNDEDDDKIDFNLFSPSSGASTFTMNNMSTDSTIHKDDVSTSVDKTIPSSHRDYFPTTSVDKQEELSDAPVPAPRKKWSKTKLDQKVPNRRNFLIQVLENNNSNDENARLANSDRRIDDEGINLEPAIPSKESDSSGRDIKSWKSFGDLNLLQDTNNAEGSYDSASSRSSSSEVSSSVGLSTGAIYASDSAISSVQDVDKQLVGSEDLTSFVEPTREEMNEIVAPLRSKKQRSKIADITVEDTLSREDEVNEPDDLPGGTDINKVETDRVFVVSANDTDSLSSIKNLDRVDDQDEVFDVEGIIKVAEESFQEELLDEFDTDDVSLAEAFNDHIEESRDLDEALILEDDKPRRVSRTIISESTTDPVEPQLTILKDNTTKLQFSFNEQEPKRPVRRSVSITRISATDIPTMGSNNELLVRKNLINELNSNIVTSVVDREPKIINLKPKAIYMNETKTDYNVILSYENNNPIRSLTAIDRTDSMSSYESAKNVRSSTESSYDSAPPPLPSSALPTLKSSYDSPSPAPDELAMSDHESRSSAFNRNSPTSSMTRKVLRESPIPSESRCSTLSRQTIPESSEYTPSEPRSSSVSRQSSFSDSDKKEFVKPHPPGTTFSISTYNSRAQRESYNKKLVRSESLSSFKDIIHPKEDFSTTPAPSDSVVDDFLWRKLSRSDSQRNEIYKSEEAIHKPFVPRMKRDFITQNSFPEQQERSASSEPIERSLLPEKVEEFPDDSSVSDNSSLDVPEDFKSRWAVFEQKSMSTNRLQDTPNHDFLSEVRERRRFDDTESKTFHLRKTKSTFDIRDGAAAAADGRMPETFGAIPDSGLNSEYMRLQDDFMKWQHQLMQNQHVLHSRVAPIASNSPAPINSMGKPGGLKLSWGPAPFWNSREVGGGGGGDVAKKPVEINIPIHFEGSDEAIQPRKTQPSPPSQTRIVNSVPQETTTQKMPSQPNIVPLSSWNAPPAVQIGAWQERPMEPRIQTQNAGGRYSQPQPFGTSNTSGLQTQPLAQQSYEPQIIQQAFQPQTMQSDFRPGYQPQVPKQDFEPQIIHQPPHAQTMQHGYQPQNMYHGYQPQKLNQGLPPQTVQQAYQPPIVQQGYQPQFAQQVYEPQPVQQTYQPPPPAQQKFKPPSPPSQVNQSSRHQQAPLQKNFQQPQPRYQTQNQPKAVSPQPTAQRNVIKATNGEPNDENINARFKSVVTLNNDENQSQRDKVRSVVQFNNTDQPTLPEGPSSNFNSKIITNAAAQNQGRAVAPPSNASQAPVRHPTEVNSSNFNNKNSTSLPANSGRGNRSPSNPPVEAPMSFRLVQQQQQQQAAVNRSSPARSTERISPPKYTLIEGPRISPSKQMGTEVLRISPPRQMVVEKPRYSPPKQMNVEKSLFAPPNVMVTEESRTSRGSSPQSVAMSGPPPPPPSGMVAPPPPPPPPPPPSSAMAERRPSTNKKFVPANQGSDQLDAREELMVAIKKFGGSGHLRKSDRPVPH